MLKYILISVISFRLGYLFRNIKIRKKKIRKKKTEKVLPLHKQNFGEAMEKLKIK